MRLTGRNGLFTGIMVIISACNKTSPLPRGTNDIQQTIGQVPSTETKTDRPSEMGEGLPGYLIDPAKLAIESQNNTSIVTGSAGAVRNQKGEAATVNVWMIRVPKRTARFEKQNKNWQLSGTQIAAVQADGSGAFKIQGTLTVDDLLFVKLEDSAGPQIQYKADTLATSVLWIDGQAAKVLDSASAEQVSAQVTAAQPNPNAAELARLIEQVKTTGQCRNCNLVGADLSNLEIPNCDLSLSNLSGVKFVLSNIAACNFSNSNLSRADFSQANVAAANLTQADITGANFSGANIEGVIGAVIPAK